MNRRPLSSAVAPFSRLAALALSACATLGGEGGGAENLPNRGIVPYETVTFVRDTVVSPWLYPPPLTPELPAVRDPSAWVDSQTGDVALFAHVTTTEGAYFGRSDARPDSDGLSFGPFKPVLAETPVDARAPSVFFDGATNTWHLLFTTNAGLMHTRSKDGRTFEAQAALWLEPEGDDEAGGLGPASLVIDGGTAHLFYEARAAGDAARVIRHAELAGLSPPARNRRTVLIAGTGCKDPQGKDFPCWDQDGVGDPEVRLATTAAGRSVWRMFFVGQRKDLGGIGFAAASAPGEDFQRYAYNPIVDDREQSRTAPSNVALGDRYLLYFGQPTTKPAVGVAENAQGVPSEVF